jgi:hypothetical protein
MDVTLFWIICWFSGFALACCLANLLGYSKKGHVLFNLWHNRKIRRLKQVS